MNLIPTTVRTYWIYVVGSRNDARVEEDGEELNDGVEPKEHYDFFATNGSVLATNVVYHDTSHNDRHNVYKACRCGGGGEAERQDCGGQELARNRPGWKRTVLAISTFRE